MSERQLSTKLEEVSFQCKQLYKRIGIDGRTNLFSRIFKEPSKTVEFMQKVFGFSVDRTEAVMLGVIAERFADFHDRRQESLLPDISPFNFFVSQGYKRGLKWRGVPLGKTCYDVSIYQQMIQEIRPKTLIELGTGLGGSSLFFLDTGRTFQLDLNVVTMDINEKGLSPNVFDNQPIEFISGDVKNIATLMPKERLKDLPHPWLIIEDCHQQVPLIMEYLYPQMEVGDYIVIEDMITPHEIEEVSKAFDRVPRGGLMVDTFYTDLFGRNVTCSPDAIFRKMKESH